jgi:hypothetical protein
MASRRRILGLGLLGLLLGGVTYAGAVLRPQMQPRAAVASGYMARVACACHFIGKRSLESCLTDKEAGMELVRVSVDPAARRVHAGIPLLASASATHTPGLGCVLDK